MQKSSILPVKSSLPRDELTQLWAKLGIAYANAPTTAPVDLEKALLCSLEHASSHRKTLRLITTWLSEFGDLVHVERLVALMRQWPWNDESSDQRPARILAATADRITEGGDRRWKAVITEFTKTLGSSLPALPASEDESFLIARDGADPYMSKFGIQTPTLDAEGEIDLSGKRKLRTRTHILMANPWLRLRAALGANWRADVLFVILNGLANNPFQASRILGCSYETAHRIWQGAIQANVKHLFRTDSWEVEIR